MSKTIITLFGGLFLQSLQAGQWCQTTFDVAEPRVPDNLCRVTLNQQELGGEIDRRIQGVLIHSNYMVVDLDRHWLDSFATARTAANTQRVLRHRQGLRRGSLFAAYTGDPKVAHARSHHRRTGASPATPTGTWGSGTSSRTIGRTTSTGSSTSRNTSTWRWCGIIAATGNPQSLAHAKIMGDYMLKTFPTPQNPATTRVICTAGLPGRDAGTVPRDRRQAVARLRPDLQYGPHGDFRTRCTDVGAGFQPAAAPRLRHARTLLRQTRSCIA